MNFLFGLIKHSADTEGVQGVRLNTPPHPPYWIYPMKMKLFGLSETKLFYIHGVFKKNEIK